MDGDRMRAAEVIRELQRRAGTKKGPTVTVGFDGCVDTVLRPVRRKNATGKPEYFSTIGRFGSFLEEKEGLSCAIETCRVSKRLGGNMPLLSAALTALGARAICVGTLGWPSPEECFSGVGEELYTLGEPGFCSALQFDDGKVMLTNMSSAQDLDFEKAKELLGMDTLRRLFIESDGTALVNWAEMPGATDLWQGIVREIWSKEPPTREKPLLIDLTDCSGRAREEIVEIAALGGLAGEYRRVIWSLNPGEAARMGDCLDCPGSGESLAKSLLERLKADMVVIHGIEFCDLAWGEKTRRLNGFAVEKPKISVGGGDSFNGALLFALLHGLPADDAALFAFAFAALYVEKGEAPSLGEMLERFNDAEK